MIDSDPVVALGKTRSLLQSGKLQGYSAETQLTCTTWPRWIIGKALSLLCYQFAVLPISFLNLPLWPSKGSLTIPFAVFEFSNVNTSIRPGIDASSMKTTIFEFSDIDPSIWISVSAKSVTGLTDWVHLNLLRRLRIHSWFDSLNSALHQVLHKQNQPNRFVHFALQMLYKTLHLL